MNSKSLISCLFLFSIATSCRVANVAAWSNERVEEIFTDIYETNHWRSSETVSGPGSTLRVTQKMRHGLTALIKRFKINSIADAPCGDCNWMQYVDIGPCKYTGIDIVKDLIERNIKIFGATKEFRHLNLLEDIIESVDLIICRDMLAHLTNKQIFTVLNNFKKSGSKYLLVTTITTAQNNFDIEVAGDWRKINFQLPPFNFPTPLAIIEEDIPFELERGKCLALWFLDDIDLTGNV